MKKLKNGNYEIEFLTGSVRSFESLNCADLGGANLRHADLKGSNLYGANLYGANLIDANLEDANLSGASLEGADLYGANLRGADLEYTNLYGANLQDADLRSANLLHTNLRDANLYDTSVLAFQLGKHFGFYHEGFVQIGCKYMPLYKWLTCFETIGKSQGYTELEIWSYGKILEYLLEREFKIQGENHE